MRVGLQHMHRGKYVWNPRKWIRDLQGCLDPGIKLSLQSSADAGMVKKKTVTVKTGDAVKTKTVVLESQLFQSHYIIMKHIYIYMKPLAPAS